MISRFVITVTASRFTSSADNEELICLWRINMLKNRFCLTHIFQMLKPFFFIFPVSIESVNMLFFISHSLTSQNKLCVQV